MWILKFIGIDKNSREKRSKRDFDKGIVLEWAAGEWITSLIFINDIFIIKLLCLFPYLNVWFCEEIFVESIWVKNGDFIMYFLSIVLKHNSWLCR